MLPSRRRNVPMGISSRQAVASVRLWEPTKYSRRSWKSGPRVMLLVITLELNIVGSWDFRAEFFVLPSTAQPPKLVCFKLRRHLRPPIQRFLSLRTLRSPTEEQSRLVNPTGTSSILEEDDSALLLRTFSGKFTILFIGTCAIAGILALLVMFPVKFLLTENATDSCTDDDKTRSSTSSCIESVDLPCLSAIYKKDGGMKNERDSGFDAGK